MGDVLRDNNALLLVAAICISDIFKPVVFNHNIPVRQQKFRINLPVIGIIDRSNGVFTDFTHYAADPSALAAAEEELYTALS